MGQTGGVAVWRASTLAAAERGPAAAAWSAMTAKRPCSFCKLWFQPDTRVGARQYACSASACQKRRRRRKQAKWRRRNPDYFVGRRWTAATAAEKPRPPRAPAPLGQVPWDVVQSQMKSKPAVILGLFGRLLLGRGAIPVRRKSPGNHGGNGASPPHSAAIPDGQAGPDLAVSVAPDVPQRPSPD